MKSRRVKVCFHFSCFFIGKELSKATIRYQVLFWLFITIKAQADELLTGDPCPSGCSICIDNCPAKALGNSEMNQQACNSYAFHTEEGEEFTFKCHLCRTKCPNCLSSKNGLFRHQIFNRNSP